MVTISVSTAASSKQLSPLVVACLGGFHHELHDFRRLCAISHDPCPLTTRPPTETDYLHLSSCSRLQHFGVSVLLWVRLIVSVQWMTTQFNFLSLFVG